MSVKNAGSPLITLLVLILSILSLAFGFSPAQGIEACIQGTLNVTFEGPEGSSASVTYGVATTPSGISVSFNPTGSTLAAGQTVSSTVKICADSGAADGQYPATLIV
ncbi:MAG: hypothetical protein NXY59_09240 [Aigarchaeota archaeon]|nr:hypothetical protein [Candidatus Pelearchaeum maunauluense]